MKNNIEENYASFELSKLLKDKGFDIIGNKWYSVEGGLYYQNEFDNNRGFVPVLECEAPTLSLAQKWVYENFGIWIYSFRHDEKEFYWSIDTSEMGYTSDDSFKSPQEALEAGLIYCLKELI